MDRALQELLKIAGQNDQLSQDLITWWRTNVVEYNQVGTITKEALEYMEPKHQEGYSEHQKRSIAYSMGESMLTNKSFSVTKRILDANKDEFVAWYDHGNQETRVRALVIKP